MKYELTFLLPEEAEIKTIKELIVSFKGKVIKEEAWGKKIMMYPIKKLNSGFISTSKYISFFAGLACIDTFCFGILGTFLENKGNEHTPVQFIG